MFRHIAVAIIDRLAAWMCCALNVLTSLFFSFLFLVTSRFRLLAAYTDEILDVDTSKCDTDIPKDISIYCMEFFGLYLSCTLIAVLLLTDRSTYWLFKVMEMFLSVTKRSKFVCNCWVNPLVTFICNRMQRNIPAHHINFNK